MFQPWAGHVPAGTELLSVQYPGRAERFRELHPEDVRELARSVVEVLGRLEQVPTLLFGHSFGGIVAFEAAVQLDSAGTPVQALWVSAVAPPGAKAHGTTHQVNDEELWRAAVALGGIDARVLEDDDLPALLLPALRADIKAHETYAPDSDRQLISAPIRGVIGNHDRLVSTAEMAGWDSLTSGPFRLTERVGAHFHIHERPDDLMRLVFHADRLAAVEGSAR